MRVIGLLNTYPITFKYARPDSILFELIHLNHLSICRMNPLYWSPGSLARHPNGSLNYLEFDVCI